MTPLVVETIAELRALLDAQRANDKSVGFVPTMGALHEGHASLIRAAREDNDVVVVSIFVNPLQFGPSEDFDKYPRTWDGDLELCADLKTDVVFHPSVKDMYPAEPLVRVTAGRLGEPLCGRTRPGHFDAVATVVAKLFEAAGPCRAYFGRKDAQQLVVIKTLARDLNMPVEVVGRPTVREPDGLAMSSRNRYLEPAEREAATVLFRALNDAERAIRDGQTSARQVAERMAAKISSEPLAKLDYAACVDAETLEDLDAIDRPALLAVAAWVGRARLIDNVTATPPGAAIREA
jgi:pantoate--beta-alanine ligase